MSVAPRLIAGRYELHGEIASGGMAVVYFGRMQGARGFSRVVALKKVHPHLAKDERVVTALWDEARMAARINHPNVIATLEVLEDQGDVFVVLEHVHGVSLSSMSKALRAKGQMIPPAVASAVMAGVLAGLHAAHESLGADGLPLGLVHRDISPQNILIGVDGLPRVIDFGIAKAAGRSQQTETGQLKGKLSYMAPEQLRNKVDRRTDLFAVGIVLWELLAARRLFDFDEPGAITHAIDHDVIVPPSQLNPAVSVAVDAVVLKALARDPDERWPNARAMATALENAQPAATTSAVAAFLSVLMPEYIRNKARDLSALQSDGQAPATSQHDAASDTRTLTARGPASSPLAMLFPKRRRSLIYVGAIALVLFAGGFAIFRHAPAQTVQSPQTVVPTAHVVRVEPLPHVTAEVPQPAPVAGDAPATLSRHPRPTQRPAVRPKIKAKAKARATKVDCDPPYWLDATGVRKPKLECL